MAASHAQGRMSRAGWALVALAGGVAAAGVRARVARRRRRAAGQAREVVLASRVYAPEPAAAALRLRGLARALTEFAEVEVLTSTPPGQQAPHDEGVRVRSWPALRDASGYIRGYAQYMSFDLPLALRLVAAGGADLVVVEPPPTTGAVSAAACALTGTPYVYYAADIWSDAAASTGAPAWVVAALARVERLVLRRARRVLAVSDGVARRATELGAGQVTVVPNGIDTDTFTDVGPRADQAPDEPYFLYAGTASEWQGAGVFIEALRLVHAEYPQARLVFLGQGSDWEQLTELADSDPRIELRGLVEPAQAAAWQRGAVASVVSIRPGLGYDFAYPTKIFAALACGTPVVYAGPGPAREDLPAAGLGWAVDYEVRAVARAMMAALAGDGAQDRAAERARRRQWVLEHRSMHSALAQAAELIMREDLRPGA